MLVWRLSVDFIARDAAIIWHLSVSIRDIDTTVVCIMCVCVPGFQGGGRWSVPIAGSGLVPDPPRVRSTSLPFPSGSEDAMKGNRTFETRSSLSPWPSIRVNSSCSRISIFRFAKKFSGEAVNGYTERREKMEENIHGGDCRRRLNFSR